MKVIRKTTVSENWNGLVLYRYSDKYVSLELPCIHSPNLMCTQALCSSYNYITLELHNKFMNSAITFPCCHIACGCVNEYHTQDVGCI